MQKNIDTSNLKFDDIYSLIKPENFKKDNPLTRNYTLQYGLGNCLKKYCGFKEDYKIKAFFEHGIVFSNHLEGPIRIHESLPSVVSSSFRKEIIENQKHNNGVYAIGPYIAYVDSLLSKEETENEKKRLGKNLLIFPAHSVKESKQNYDVENFCEKIKEISTDYDSVRVCLYWKDVTNGYGELYKQYGVEVVTAGYINDPLFLNRLRSIIECSTVTMSNKIGTHVGFTLYLKKPHYIINIKTESQEAIDTTINKMVNKAKFKLQKRIKENNNDKDIKQIEQLLTCKAPNEKELSKLLNKYFGFNEVKSKEQLKDIMLSCENQYSPIKFYLKIVVLLKNYMVSLLKTFI
ncbi:MAG: hypothetical protein LBC39_08590 [Methanobrevibacter sp.]|jgi:hypothetical protein|nr:hypothetical protein [Candidatus Methanovirga aequatorialis]